MYNIHKYKIDGREIIIISDFYDTCHVCSGCVIYRHVIDGATVFTTGECPVCGYTPQQDHYRSYIDEARKIREGEENTCYHKYIPEEESE